MPRDFTTAVKVVGVLSVIMAILPTLGLIVSIANILICLAKRKDIKDHDFKVAMIGSGLGLLASASFLAAIFYYSM